MAIFPTSKRMQWCTVPWNWDSDGDGMSDGFEVYYNLDPTYHADKNLDPDGDGVPNFQEYELSTQELVVVESHLDRVDGTLTTGRFVDSVPVLVHP